MSAGYHAIGYFSPGYFHPNYFPGAVAHAIAHYIPGDLQHVATARRQDRVAAAVSLHNSAKSIKNNETAIVDGQNDEVEAR